MTSTIKVDNIQDQDGNNIINENSNTITIGASGDTVVLASGASQTGFGRTGTVDWQTGSIKTSGFTAANGEGYFCNTSGGAFTVTLPSSPSAGNIVAVADYTRTFGTNNLTIGRNSQPIGGVAQDAILTVSGQSATFVYVDSTEGWININETQTSVTGASPFIVATGGTITTSGDYRIHTFTGPGTFDVTQAAGSCGPTRNQVSYLVVGGGAGGGGGGCGGDGGGGGGAGGFREKKAPLSGCYTASPLDGAPAITVTAQAYPITVGAGGSGGTGPGNANPGSDTTFSTVTSAGGGYGQGNVAGPAGPGGSGGGGRGGGGTGYTKGTGNQPPVSPAQGQPGGTGGAAGGANPQSPDNGAGAGGGATGAGGNAGAGPAGAGGAGATTSISATPTAYAGGGGGSGFPGGAGGTGGGGAGTNLPTSSAGTAGTANTGGGGGGGKNGGAGGSGVVIIRYKYQ